MPRLEKAAAEGAHTLLYVLMIVLPLTGWALDVWSRPLMGHSYRVIRRMRYGTDSTRERHNDRAAVFRVKRLEGATACDP